MAMTAEARDAIESGTYTDYLLARNETLRMTLESHSVKLMGPHSPFWRCQYCAVLSQSPLNFEHKPECVMAKP